MQKLAEETLAAILALALVVPDDDFACTKGRVSPFTNIEVSSSALLLVCERWARIGTPLLYEAVVLRSMAQCRALAATLKANKTLARFIKRLRVEGGFGASVPKIFRAARNVTEICLPLYLFSTDNSAPMYDALFKSVAPRRLVICASKFGETENKQIGLAVSALAHCISNWTCLNIVTLPVSVVVVSSEILSALCAARNLELVEFPRCDRGSSFARGSDKTISKLAADSCVRTIRVGWPEVTRDKIWDRYYNHRKDLGPEAQAKIQFSPPKLTHLEQCARDIAASSDPLLPPMCHAPEDVQASIWGRILQHVIDNTNGIDHQTLFQSQLDRNDECLPLPRGPVLQCMTVCKQWKIIALPLACRNVALRNTREISDFTQLIRDNDQLRALVRTVRLGRASLSELRSNGQDQERDAEAATLIPELLGLVSNLEVLRTRQCDFGMAALEAASALRLVELSVDRSLSQETYLLPSFPALRKLHWSASSGTAFAVNDSTKPALPSLEELSLDGPECDGLLRAMSKFSLPRLAVFRLQRGCSAKALSAFVKVHGHALQTFRHSQEDDAFQRDLKLRVVLRGCANLTLVDISAYYTPPRPDALEPHTSLQELSCPRIDCIGLFQCTIDKEEVRRWSTFLDALQPESLPALRTVRIAPRHVHGDFNLWPPNQREMTKNPAPALAEKLLERGIRMVDSDGVGWRPRLTFHGK